MKKKLLIIITASVSCFKALELIRILQKKGHIIDVILTKTAEKFISKMQVTALTSRQTYGEEDWFDGNNKMTHIELSKGYDLTIVAPATADIISKSAHAMADDLASIVILAADSKNIFVPAMNHRMWNNRLLQKNVEILRNEGKIFVMPEEGEMACGEFGFGKLASIDKIITAIEENIS